MRLFFACLFWADSIFIFHIWQTLYCCIFLLMMVAMRVVQLWNSFGNVIQIKKKSDLRIYCWLFFFLVWPFINSKTRTKFVILKKVSMYIVHVHQFNETLRSDLKGELYPVKSIHNFIGCHLKFFRTASAQIFFQGIFFLMLSLRSFK